MRLALQIRRRAAVLLILTCAGGALAASIVGGGIELQPIADCSNPIDINHAAAAELSLLPGIGPSVAAAIVADRTARGPFALVTDLERVRGIGPSTMEHIQPHITAGRVPVPASCNTP